jgi:hypothetical protein
VLERLDEQCELSFVGAAWADPTQRLIRGYRMRCRHRGRETWWSRSNAATWCRYTH